ncbi:MAG TPA: hypothetical protein VJU77_18890 [Chthoniobacterales bacterium]|nr:hypothetical protein [Chthoniobacterales bacterium]
MFRIVTAFAFVALLVRFAGAADWREVDSILPRALEAGETAFIQVQVGTLARGKEIEVTTTSEHELGVISPHGIRTGQEAGIYTLPVPSEFIVNGHIIVRLSLSYRGAHRAPTNEEVKSVRVKIAGGEK